MNQLSTRIIMMILMAVLVAQPDQIAAAGSVPGKDSAHVSRALPSALQKPPSQERLPRTRRIIIRFRDTDRSAGTTSINGQEMQRLSAGSGVDLAYFRTMSGGAHVLQLSAYLSVEEMWAISQRLMALP